LIAFKEGYLLEEKTGDLLSFLSKKTLDTFEVATIFCKPLRYPDMMVHLYRKVKKHSMYPFKSVHIYYCTRNLL
jgi:hypothetical protein